MKYIYIGSGYLACGFHRLMQNKIYTIINDGYSVNIYTIKDKIEGIYESSYLYDEEFNTNFIKLSEYRDKKIEEIFSD